MVKHRQHRRQRPTYYTLRHIVILALVGIVAASLIAASVVGWDVMTGQINAW